MLDVVNQEAITKLFCLADSAILPAADWITVKVGGRFLTHGPELPARRIEVDGDEGILVGWPTALSGNVQYDQQSLGEIGGRWAFITADYIRPDPLATYSIVFSTEHNIAAASPAVIPGHLLTPDNELNNALNLPETDHWYPFGLTPWKNLTRLLPNHVLDLETHTASRLNRDVTVLDEERALLRVSENLKNSVATMGESDPITILATAGNDSRILLSAAKGAPKVKLLTFITPSSATDVNIAKRLSRLTGFEHTTAEVKRGEAEERAWFEIVGQCVAGASLRSAALKTELASEQRYLKGIGGEIGRRTNYYRPGDEARLTISPEDLIRRLHLPNHARLHEAAKNWLDELSDYQDASELIEIVYRENRIGAWASPQLHGDSIRSIWLFPLNQQTTIDALRFLGPETKNARTSPRTIINHLWPELLSVPINPLSAKQKAIKFAKRIRSTIIPKSK